MRALAFGTYDRAYPRNAQVFSALRRAGVDVVECNRAVWGRHNWSPGARDVVRLARAELDLARRTPQDADVVLVGYPGHADMLSASRVARGRPIVFNPLVSLTDTMVVDRERFASRGLAARAIGMVDRYAFRRADLVVADTAAHASFFAETFGLAPERVGVAFVGAEDRLFTPSPRNVTTFNALFVGKLIPLHGLDTIVAAAELAREVPFTIVGDGQLSALLGQAPENVTLIPWVEYEALPELYRTCGCALGVFGTSPKAARVIPNKAFQALACAAPLVTADTPAARELLTDGADALLVPPGDPAALARAIRRLASDRPLAERIGAAGRQTYEVRASEGVLGQTWKALLERAVAS